MTLRSAFALAATLTVAAPVGAAFAAPAYDARTLGMGNSTVGYSGNASLAYWNPAAVGNGSKFGMFLPSLSASFSNNLLSPADVAAYASAFQNLGKPGAAAPSNNIFANLGSSNGLNLQMDTIVEPLGLSLGKIGPGNAAIRVYGHGVGFAQAKLSSEFSGNLNSLFVGNGFTDITNTIKAISDSANNPNAASQDELKANVDKLGSLLKSNMSAFIKPNGNYTAKTLDLTSVTSVNAAVAATYAQPVPVKVGLFPEGQLTVGATAKLFAAPSMAIMAPMQLPGAPSSSLNPVGGGVGANINLNVDKEVTELSDAIGRFQEDQNLATTAELMSKTGAFFNQGLAKSNIAFSSVTPDNVGFGMDFGASYRFNKQFSAGLALTNPLMLWGAQKSTYTYDFSGDEIRVNTRNERTSFSQAEPFVVRVGGAYQPDLQGPPILVKDILVTAGVDAPLNNGIAPSVSLGAEKLFGPLALRLGTQQGGLSPLYTVGLGLQTSAFQMNLGLGVDSPSTNVKGAAAALSLGAGF
jgi:hypothetical protein